MLIGQSSEARNLLIEARICRCYGVISRDVVQLYQARVAATIVDSERLNGEPFVRNLA